MRSADSFRRSHLKLMESVVGGDTEMSGGELSKLGLVELSLHFLASCMPGTKVDAGPYLLLGHHGVVSSFAPSGGVLVSVRPTHLDWQGLLRSGPTPDVSLFVCTT